MLLIVCPFCGERDEVEFRWGGEGGLVRPGPAEAVSEEAWRAYLFERTNPRGPVVERWVHFGGCKQWLNVARDTRTHVISAVWPMGEDPPKGAA